MIRFAGEKDKEALLALCIQSQPMKESSFLTFYFENYFEEANALISELDNKIVSQVHMQEHILHFDGKLLCVSFLFAIATHYDYQNRGIMRDLMEMMLEDCKHNHLLTFVEASNVKLYEKFGFETISSRKRYIVYAKELIRFTSEGISENASAKELAELYHAFAKRFDCYYERDEVYYERYIQLTKANHCILCILRNEEGNAQGYALYKELDDGIEVKEIIYFDAQTLCKLLRYAIGYNPFVSIEVSSAERLEKIFKLSVPRTHACVMVRINDLKLYNKLYNTNVKNTKEALSKCKKAILLNEKY